MGDARCGDQVERDLDVLIVFVHEGFAAAAAVLYCLNSTLESHTIDHQQHVICTCH